MTPAETIAWGAVALAGVAGSALCSGLEIGSYRVNRVRLGARIASGSPDRRLVALERELDKPDGLLATLLLGNNAANYCGTLGVTALLGATGLSEPAQIAASALLVTPILVVFGETVPKELFRTRADRWMPRLVGVLIAMRLLMTALFVLPVVLVFSRLVARLAGVKGAGLTAAGRARLRALLGESAGYGAIRSGQQDLVERALRLGGKRVGEVMTPWRHAVTVGADWPPERVLTALRERPRTRVPVMDARGRPVGVARLTDLALAGGKDPASWAAEAPVLDPADGVRESLAKLRAAKARLAIVQRRGRALGVVSVADLARPLTGTTGKSGPNPGAAE